MSGQLDSKLTNDLIREALELELDCIEAPPAAKIWSCIEAELGHARTPARRRATFTWSRFAAVAAAFLVITLGGIGLFRTVQFTALVADSDPGYSANDDIVALQFDEQEVGFAESQDVGVLEPQDTGEIIINDGKGSPPKDEGFPDPQAAGERVFDELPGIYGEPDLNPPDWPYMLSRDLMLNRVLLYTAGGEPRYRGAVYQGDNLEILLLRSVAADEEMNNFMEQLGNYLAVDIGSPVELEGYYLIEADELPGLVWQENGFNQALIVLYGNVSGEELMEIAQDVQ